MQIPQVHVVVDVHEGEDELYVCVPQSDTLLWKTTAGCCDELKDAAMRFYVIFFPL